MTQERQPPRAASRLRELFRYGVAGGVAAGCHLLVLWLLVEPLDTNETLASAIGFLCAVPVNYFLQRVYVFKASVELWSSFTIYCAVTAATLVFNTALFWLLLSSTGLHYLLVQVITTTVIVLVNYQANRQLTFASPPVH